MELMQQLTLCVALLVATAIVSNDGQFLPGPRYSLDNMPKTGFTCRDKILGGYYADSETQCQMFHVCVKVAGVGVQDFRFLCPNGTAFDQEAQICADWGDVDCEAATLYYGSDNFDLYRLGSGFESKRAPFAEEEEATFHLQRAETSDARRSKQYIVNQSSKPQQPPSLNQIPSLQKPSQQQQHQQQQQQYYRPPSTTTTSTTTTTTTTTTTPAPPAENIFYKTTQYPTKLHQKHVEHKQHQLLLTQQQLLQAQHYRQLTAVAATATPSDRRPAPEEIRTTTPSFNTGRNHNTNNNFGQQPAQQQPQPNQQQRPAHNDLNNDEIFRGSHSSHFFNNRNNGKEDYEEEFYRKTTTTIAPRAATTVSGSGTNSNRSATAQPGTRGRNRGRGSIRAHHLNALRNELKPTTLAPSTVAAQQPRQQPQQQRQQQPQQQRAQPVQQQQRFPQQPAQQQQPTYQQQQPIRSLQQFPQHYPRQQQQKSQPQQQQQQQQQQPNTKLQTTTPDDFVDIPKIPNFRQQPTTVLKPQQPAAPAQSAPQVSPFNQAIISTPAPFASRQPPQGSQQNRNSNPFYNPQQKQPVPSSSTTTQAPVRETFKITVTNNQQQQPQQQQQQQFSFNSQPRQQFPSTASTSSTTQASVNNPFQFFTSPTTTIRPRAAFEARATERSFDEGVIVTTPQESQRIRPQSRTFNVVDPGRLSQFNYNEYQGSRTSTTTTTTASPPPAPTTFAPLAAQQNFQRQRQPVPQQQQQQQQQNSAFLNPFFNSPVNKPVAGTTAPQVAITTISPDVVQRAVPKERYQSIARTGTDGHTPSTVKKFSTLVPKDQYNPTTFKPNAISKKALLQFVNQKSVIGLEKSPFVERVTTTEKPAPPQPATTRYPGYIPTIPPVTATSTSATTTTTTTTRAPYTTSPPYIPTTITPPNRFFQPPIPKAPAPKAPSQAQFIGGPATTTTTTTSTTTTTTVKPEIDEDDGQYHPELYEKDFYRNRVKAKTAAAAALAAARNTNGLASLSTSDEEEIFRTAHSQNIAASGNDLILERARQAAARINEFFSSSSVKPTTTTAATGRNSEATTQKQSIAGGAKHRKDSGASRSKSAHGTKGSSNATPRPFSKAPTIPPNATITKRPPEDDSYDYAYYDTAGIPDLPEYDIIEDFGRKRV
ncbi:mucin-5AC-like [Anopheles albimanus]|uniref:mucin-5AC-like n=1 Tax=Anopheles albimanus TaxID=7167 RepID=UPI001641DD16|nr:mucin-5AC-like [Anopheles albimanus]XP_035780636.1 mucin-5AC-like [Anopheles albimanus]XP_035780637.1 mucin-5AC-like [Anopheles albimanus]XP_035780638.1 mucin-5AC-like [Anopheles albimanus]